jgi:4-amino-4-deoxy-L-arabinose transferase-like glycosyltransferase
MMISVLAALVFFERRGGQPFLIGSGVTMGLAMLTKAPAIFLVGFVPLLGFSWSLLGRKRFRISPLSLSLTLQSLILWGLIGALTFVLLWPAVWVDPIGTLGRMFQEVRATGESDRPNGNFFLGQPNDGDIGPLFYPLATLLRLSPITVLGLVLLFIFWLTGQDAASRARWRRYALALAAYALLFTLLMTISPKKIDRYLLPVFSATAILAAIGLRLALRRLPIARVGRFGRWASLALTSLIVLAHAAQLIAVQPYPLSYYNPLFGGIRTARELVIVGWGEGLDQVATYLDRQPNAANSSFSTLYWQMIQPRFRGRGLPLGSWRRADYFVDYVNMDQRRLVPSAMQEVVRTQQPLFTARVNGLEYARVYRVPASLKR